VCVCVCVCARACVCVRERECVCIFVRCIYGLCQSPRAFFLLTKDIYVEAGLIQLKSDLSIVSGLGNNRDPASLVRKKEDPYLRGSLTLAPQDSIQHGLASP